MPAAGAGEFRPIPAWTAMRTVCHGCRGVAHELYTDEAGASRLRSVVVPGDGTVTRVVAADAESGEMMVSQQCQVCSDSETPGWLSGFVPPV